MRGTIYSQTIGDENWSAIQISTAASVCAALDLKFAGKLPEKGFVAQEQIELDDFLANRFGRYYTHGAPLEGAAAAQVPREGQS